jgi:hypothetical protein
MKFINISSQFTALPSILATKVHKDTQRGLRPQPKKSRRVEGWKVRKRQKKIRQNFLPQKYRYNLVSSFRPKYLCQKNKKLTESTTKKKRGRWENSLIGEF